MVIADDEAWGITVSGHRKSFGESLSSELGPVDFAALAEACGAVGVRVDDTTALREAMRRGLRESKPVVIHAPIRGGLPQGG
jgi:thiamine pyrophosphate-dependent acetolactate synthase large subunit-like protein